MNIKANVNLSNLYNRTVIELNIEEKWNELLECIIKAIYSLPKINLNKTKKEWITKELLNLIEKKRQALQEWRSVVTEEQIQKETFLRIEYKKMCRIFLYYTKIIKMQIYIILLFLYIYFMYYFFK